MRNVGMIVLAAALFLQASQATAAFIVSTGVTSVPGDEEVVFNLPGDRNLGGLIQGDTVISRMPINIGGDQNLTTPLDGPARIVSLQDRFDYLNFTVDKYHGRFASVAFNIIAREPGNVTINAWRFNVATGLYFDNTHIVPLVEGPNSLAVTSTNGKEMWGVSVISNAQWDEVNGIRIGGAVPEPSSIALLVTAATSFFLIRRRT